MKQTDGLANKKEDKCSVNKKIPASATTSNHLFSSLCSYVAKCHPRDRRKFVSLAYDLFDGKNKRCEKDKQYVKSAYDIG